MGCDNPKEKVEDKIEKPETENKEKVEEKKDGEEKQEIKE